MTIAPRRKCDGFTLLEVVVALALLSSTILLAYQVIAGAIVASDRAKRSAAAAFLGESLVRETSLTFPETGQSEGRFPGLDNAFRFQKMVAGTIHKDAREIHVTVYWSDEQTDSITVSGIAVR